MSRGAARAGALLTMLLLVSGCTRLLDGVAQPAAGLTPQPVTGATIHDVLVDRGTLERTLAQSLEADPVFPPWTGSTDQLYDPRGAPPDCVAATTMWSADGFGGPDVGDAVRETWQNSSPIGDDPVAIGLDQGVVAYPNAAAADAQFDVISARWQRCDGTTVRNDGSMFADQITDVQVANSVVDAAVHVTGTVTVHHAQAIGVRVNCLVVVDIAFYGDRVGAALDDTDPKHKNDAVDLVRQMMDRVSELS